MHRWNADRPMMSNRSTSPLFRSRRSGIALVSLALGTVFLISGFSGGHVQAPSQNLQGQAREVFEARVAEWQAALSLDDQEGRTEAIGTIAEQLFDLDALAEDILGKEWRKLSAGERVRLRQAVKASMDRLGTPFLRQEGVGRASLRLTEESPSGNTTTLKYQMERPGSASIELRVTMAQSNAGPWRVTDITYGNRALRKELTSFAQKAFKDYSLPYLVAALTDAETIVLEDFEDGLIDSLPVDWKWKGSDNKKHKPYAVRADGDNHYLEARDQGESVILAKEIKWDLEEYPYVSFRLQIIEIPEGGDERNDKTVDSAAGIYFTYKRKLGLIPESVKYVWSSTLPVGSAVLRNGTGRPWMVVVGTGREQLGEWRTYVFDLREAYRDTFGGNPPDTPLGIGVLSDANSTKSHAFANYDDIRALRHADGTTTSGVTTILKPTKD